jgi:hypothetical protein
MAATGNSYFWLVMQKVNWQKTTDAKWWQKLTLPLARWAKKFIEIWTNQKQTLTNMAATGNSCFWLADLKKIFSSETTRPNQPNLCRKHLWKVLWSRYERIKNKQVTVLLSNQKARKWYTLIL